MFGYSGGGEIHLYYDKDELILGLVPKLESDTIHAIIVITEKFKSNEGLNITLTFEQLEKLYPSTEIYLNEKFNWEWCLYENQKMHVVFMTEKDSRVAEYEYDSNFTQKTVRIVNKNVKIDWIAIE